MHDVCCLGILVVDITATPIDNLPNAGGLALLDDMFQGLGGCAANTAMALGKIGYNTAVIGKVGKDSFGTYTLNTLSESRVDISGIACSDDAPTSSAIVALNSHGERSFLHCRGSNGTICADDIDFSVIEKSKILHIAGSLLMPRLDGEPLMKILKRAKESGIYTALDTAWDASGRWMELIEPCLPYLDLFIPSIDEARMLSGKENVSDIADIFLEKGASLCVIKMGGDGCYIKDSEGNECTVPVFKGISVKDTTGAGDAFVAGFLAGLLNEWEIYKCGQFANAVGAMCVSDIGTTAGIRSMKETLQFIEEHNAD